MFEDFEIFIPSLNGGEDVKVDFSSVSLEFKEHYAEKWIHARTKVHIDNRDVQNEGERILCTLDFVGRMLNNKDVGADLSFESVYESCLKKLQPFFNS